MPVNNTINLVAQQWTLITSSNVTTLRIQNQGKLPLYLKATVRHCSTFR